MLLKAFPLLSESIHPVLWAANTLSHVLSKDSSSPCRDRYELSPHSTRWRKHSKEYCSRLGCWGLGAFWFEETWDVCRLYAWVSSDRSQKWRQDSLPEVLKAPVFTDFLPGGLWFLIFPQYRPASLPENCIRAWKRCKPSTIHFLAWKLWWKGSLVSILDEMNIFSVTCEGGALEWQPISRTGAGGGLFMHCWTKSLCTTKEHRPSRLHNHVQVANWL